MICARELVWQLCRGPAHLPVCGGQRDAREQPAVARGLVRGEADVLVGPDDGVSAKVPPAALHVRVEVWLAAALERLQRRGGRLTDSRLCVRSCGAVSRGRVECSQSSAYRDGLDVGVFTQPQALHAREAPRQQAHAGPWSGEQHCRTARWTETTKRPRRLSRRRRWRRRWRRRESRRKERTRPSLSN